MTSNDLSISGEEGFYNIAHMANTKAAVDWALGRGANAVELDLAFNTATGDLQNFYHGTPCDCSCRCPAPLWSLCRNDPSHGCSVLINDVSSGSPCNAQSSVSDMLRHLASKTQLALVIFDNKIEMESMSNDVMRMAGRNIVTAVNNYLFGSGYNGKVIIGSPKLDSIGFLRAAVEEVLGSAYESRIYFTIDYEKNNVVETLVELHSLPTSNIVYGTGTSACALRSTIKDETLKLAALNKANGLSGFTYIWTLDKDSSMKHYLPYVQGLMTNYPGDLNDILREAGIKLATPSSTIPTTTNSAVITSMSGFSCDCDYRPGGCSISEASPANMACKCIYKGFWTCGGEVVKCLDSNSPYCKTPDKSVQACFQGNGDCEGYRSASCDCDYHSGGCTISKVPPPNTACKCKYKGLWTCGGDITRCRNFNSHYCKHPDFSINTCYLGGGDCGGY